MKKQLRVLLIVSSAILLLAGCGGGGGGGGTVELCIEEWDYWIADNLGPLTSDNLVDTYDLDSFQFEVWQDAVSLGIVYEYMVPIWSGTMDIQSTTITQNITIYGETALVVGSYTVSIADTTSGTLHITDSTGLHDVDFYLNGTTMTTYSGRICVDVPANQLDIEPLAVGMSNRMGSMLGDMFMK